MGREEQSTERGMKPNCKIVIQDGVQFLTMPDGTLIPGQVFCRVTDAVNDAPYAIVKVFIDLHDSETVNKYKNANPEP